MYLIPELSLFSRKCLLSLCAIVLMQTGCSTYVGRTMSDGIADAKTRLEPTRKSMMATSDNVEERMGEGWTPGWADKVSRYARPAKYQKDLVQGDPAPDAATVARGWEASRYAYPTGAIIAYPTYNVNYEDRWDIYRDNDRLYAFVGPAVLLLDIAAMPFWMIAEPPLTRVTYHGVHYPPSTTIAPANTAD